MASLPTSPFSFSRDSGRQRTKASDLSLLEFAQQVIPGYETPPHIQRLAAALEAVERGDIDRLMIHMPPRHGKSLLSSIIFPAWYLGRHSERKVIDASYGAELAHENGRQARNIVMSETFGVLYPGVCVVDDSQAAHRWHTPQGGGLVATGIPGPITGRGSNCLLVDDPLRGMADAMSETVRESIWQWWQTDARTRLEPPSAVVMPCTRWHEDDLPGRLLAQDASSWHVISMPAIDDAGAALWPERFPLEYLERTRREMGEAHFQALYQQAPVSGEGRIFRWFPEYGELPKLSAIYIPIDTAYTAQESSDYTAWSAWGSDGARVYLLDAGRCQEEAPSAERQIRLFYESMRSRFPGLPVSVLVRKRVAIDRIAAQHLQVAGIPAVPVDLPAVGTKEALANLVVHRFEGGTALVPAKTAGNGWYDGWLYEHKSFPLAKHDDWVETTLVVLHYLASAWTGGWPQIETRPQAVMPGWRR